VQLARLRRMGKGETSQFELEQQVTSLRESLYSKSCEATA